MKEEKKRRSALSIMGSLIILVKPLIHIMLLAIVLGTLGYLCAIFLTILAGQVIVHGILTGAAGEIPIVNSMWLVFTPVKTIFIIMIVIAVLRGLLHYAEQYCNHFIAFKLLAIIRHKVFAALRKLCPAKLEGKDRGNLISIITTDIELLEVFYAHTISPIAIAFLTSLVMVIFIGGYSIWATLLAFAAYITVGVVIPMCNSRCGAQKGMKFRNEFGELNSFVLDSLRGLDETIQYGQSEHRKEEMSKRSNRLAKMQGSLNKMEGSQRAVTNLVILLASFAMLALTIKLYADESIGFEGIITCTIAMMGSFGPVVALSSLSNNLNQTLASGERVLTLLEEEPVINEISGDGLEKEDHCFEGAKAEDVCFTYKEEIDESGDSEYILKNFNIDIKPGMITGIHGPSGCGKSTLLKLLMRFWDVNSGRISVNKEDVRAIPTRKLRDMESYVTQETQLFHDTIANNIAIAKADATREEIIEAAKKASIHEFIMTLPNGYDTEVGELGDTLSGGEKQRIGIARAFLHEADLILMDEPTSNLDSLNEGIIIKALKEASGKKTVVIVSHRDSTMNAADVVYEMR